VNLAYDHEDPMAKRRPRQRQQRLTPPTSDYTNAEGNVLTLRGSVTASTRVRYARTLAGGESSAASTPEDAWQRAVELLFEHLAVRWVIARARSSASANCWGASGRRVAPSALGCAKRSVSTVPEHFPDVKAP
jgi:hypothetical protein